MESKKETLKTFLKPSMVSLYIAAVALAIGIVGSFFAPYPGTPLILFSILAVILAVGPLLKLWETNSFLADAEDNGTLDAIYDTYQNGLSLLGGTVRIGQEYILGQNCLVATKISDIEQVYEYIRKTNGAVSHHPWVIHAAY